VYDPQNEARQREPRKEIWFFKKGSALMLIGAGRQQQHQS